MSHTYVSCTVLTEREETGGMWHFTFRWKKSSWDLMGKTFLYYRSADSGQRFGGLLRINQCCTHRYVGFPELSFIASVKVPLWRRLWRFSCCDIEETIRKQKDGSGKPGYRQGGGGATPQWEEPAPKKFESSAVVISGKFPLHSTQTHRVSWNLTVVWTCPIQIELSVVISQTISWVSQVRLATVARISVFIE